MSSISTIALCCAPIAASNAVFSVRRASRGVDAIDENPLYGAMNLDIAAGQTLKGTRAASALAVAADPSLAKATEGAAESIKNLSRTSKVFNGLGKIVKFTANNINPIICVTSGAKVLGSDDKLDTAARETLALSAMFSAEALAKKAIGMPYVEKGETKARNAYFEKQISAIEDFCSTRKLFNKYSLKYAPGIGKGLFFVGASIAGYKLGSLLGNYLLGEQEQKISA